MNSQLNPEWYKTWFDTSYYHVLYAKRDHGEAAHFIDVLLDLLSLEKGDKVMDLACGKGRHALHMSSRGLVVTGLDLSENSIASLRHLNNEQLHFERWDMRDNYHESAFDAVFNLFTSFGYFDSMSENSRVLETMKEAIGKDGDIIIDYLNVKKALSLIDKKEHVKRNGLEFLTSKSLKNDCIIKDILVKDGVEELRFSESVQALTLDDFEGLIEKAGLELVNTYGDYHLSPFNERTSARLILHLKRNS